MKFAFFDGISSIKIDQLPAAHTPSLRAIARQSSIGNRAAYKRLPRQKTARNDGLSFPSNQQHTTAITVVVSTPT